MSGQAGRPQLTPQLCFSSATLRDFLRLSRSSLDDSISQQLNALVRPAGQGFDPASTSQLGPRRLGHIIDSRSCAAFKEKILFPTWQARSDVLNYCAVVATSPDPDDPDTTLREAETERDRQRIVDERLDPYSGRFFPREPRTEILTNLIRQERAIENIVRRRTWATIQERCGEGTSEWEAAFHAWAKKSWVPRAS
ncbi:related to caffeine-induced death protein Cid2 [Cephalotrichum gorgonifer]|uniref:Related to caffeine-induced death protein Cid2 n=1 Tax=Cephalotrichum gorgonifer TaxID=2041049 RepID=A0AAE8N260_9PEZI|nr:related to caffeine-induced death protein Cid2 [Cephalotrichum gorgonifer]